MSHICLTDLNQEQNKAETIGLDAEARLGIKTLHDIATVVLNRDRNGACISIDDYSHVGVFSYV